MADELGLDGAAGTTGAVVGRVSALWHYPVKSMQGLTVDRLGATEAGFVLDREWALVDPATERVLSAKTVPDLLRATVAVEADDDVTISLPDGTTVRPDDRDADAVLSAWLGRTVVLRNRGEHHGGGYDMTFDPPDDDAEQYEIPVPEGSFLDLATVHLVTSATLDHARASAPELDWDVRRFRPNVVIASDGEPFAEDGWSGRSIAVGPVTVAVQQPTVRCAMPLRAQPGLPRSVDTYRALQAVHANHLGVYGALVGSGTIAVGDEVRLA